jgi:hypothetical protein
MVGRVKKLAGLSIALLSCSGNIDPVANTVVERTRQTQSTYAVYLWGSALDKDGNTEEHWSAEFHSGDWHRMDSPKIRVIANCRTHVGYFHDVATGQTTDAPNAYRGSCGIYDAPDVSEIIKLDSISSDNRQLDQIKITDAKFIRQYAIDSDGVIVGSDWTAKDGSAAPCVKTRAIAVIPILPEKDIFSEVSLARSVVPVQYQSMPKKLAKLHLSGRRCGLLN